MEAQALASSITVATGISRSVLSHGSRACSCRLKIFSRAEISAWRSLGKKNSARASSSAGDTLESTCTSQISQTIPKLKIGSPLLWIAVGIGLSAWFSVMATKVKRYAINQAFKAVMSEKEEANGQFYTSAFAEGSPFPSSISLPSQPAEALDDNYTDEVKASILPADYSELK